MKEETLAAIEAAEGTAGKALVLKAHAYMQTAHEGQNRLDGKPFYTHPEAVADFLVAHGYTDPELLAAALLHDVVEDTERRLDEIREEFGEEITFLVDGATKYGVNDGNKPIADEYKKMLATHKKVLEYGAKDKRVFIVKIADRAHNLRTLHVHAPDKQAKIKKQSREFHVKLIEELGDDTLMDVFTELL